MQERCTLMHADSNKLNDLSLRVIGSSCWHMNYLALAAQSHLAAAEFRQTAA
jgi:hypothetical protein